MGNGLLASAGSGVTSSTNWFEPTWAGTATGQWPVRSPAPAGSPRTTYAAPYVHVGATYARSRSAA